MIAARVGRTLCWPAAFLVLCLSPLAALAQAPEDADATIARILAQQFSEWTAETGRPFHRPPGESLTGRWTDGTRRLTIEIQEADSPDDLDWRHQLFQTRPMMPPNRALAHVGGRAHLFEVSDRVEIGFTSEQDLLYVVVTLHLAGLPRGVAAAAPPLDVERAVTLTRAIAGAIGATTGADQWAAHIDVAFARQGNPPPAGIPREARGAGLEPQSDRNDPRDPPVGVRFGVVTNPNDHGTLSTFVHGRISSLEVTWTDPEIFPDDESAVRFLRSRLGAALGSRHTFVFWSQALGTPSLTANVRHVSGMTGRLLIWRYKDISALHELYAYLDGDGTWWFGSWPNVAY